VLQVFTKFVCQETVQPFLLGAWGPFPPDEHFFFTPVKPSPYILIFKCFDLLFKGTVFIDIVSGLSDVEALTTLTGTLSWLTGSSAQEAIKAEFGNRLDGATEQVMQESGGDTWGGWWMLRTIPYLTNVQATFGKYLDLLTVWIACKVTPGSEKMLKCIGRPPSAAWLLSGLLARSPRAPRRC